MFSAQPESAGRLHGEEGSRKKLMASSPGEKVEESKKELMISSSGEQASGASKELMASSLEETDQDSMEQLVSTLKNEIRIVLIGRTGSGKSASGNTILRKMVFESKASSKSVTSKCEWDFAEHSGKSIHIVDTPGLFDNNMTEDDVKRECVKCIAITCPGPHAFILVVSIGCFTEEVSKTVKELQKYFGNVMMRYLIILFTKSDYLEDKTIEQYVKEVPSGLADCLRECNNRFFAFNNKASSEDKDRQVRQFLQIINQMVEDNGGSYYSNEVFVEAEKVMSVHGEAIWREREENHLKEEEQLRRIYEDEKKKIIEEHRELFDQLGPRISQLEATDGRTCKECTLLNNTEHLCGSACNGERPDGKMRQLEEEPENPLDQFGGAQNRNENRTPYLKPLSTAFGKHARNKARRNVCDEKPDVFEELLKLFKSWWNLLKRMLF